MKSCTGLYCPYRSSVRFKDMSEIIKTKHAAKSSLLYRRDIYRLWFDYLRLARASDEPRVKAALANSAIFYAPWGDVTNVKFDKWWKTHGHLFEEKHVVRRLRNGEAPSDPSALVIQVPLTQSQSILTKGVRAVIREAFAEQGRVTKKAKKRPTSSYSPTQGAEPKRIAVHQMLVVYRDVYLKTKPRLRGKKLLGAVHKFYQGRKRKKAIPMQFMRSDYSGKGSPLRNLRRYIQKAEKIMRNVADGEFPGRY